MNNIENLREGHKLLSEFKYELSPIDRGYTNRTLYVNVSDNRIEEHPVTELMKDKFLGGKGFGLYKLWNAVTPDTSWDSAENEIVISTGPFCGITQYPGAGKSLVVTISPLTGIPFDSNVGGYFGPYLKFAGFDSLEIQGKAEKDVMIFIDGNKGIVRIEEVPFEAIDGHLLSRQLTEMYAESEEEKRNISVVTARALSLNQVG